MDGSRSSRELYFYRELLFDFPVKGERTNGK